MEWLGYRNWDLLGKLKVLLAWAVVVAQLVERLLLNHEVRGSDTAIGKICIQHILLTVLKSQK